MKQIPTAEELLYKTLLEGIVDRRGKDGDGLKPEIYAYNLSSKIRHRITKELQNHNTVIAMIEFAKLHVKAALEAVAKNGKETWDWTTEECNSIIEDAYPENLIK